MPVAQVSLDAERVEALDADVKDVERSKKTRPRLWSTVTHGHQSYFQLFES